MPTDAETRAFNLGIHAARHAHDLYSPATAVIHKAVVLVLALSLAAVCFWLGTHY